jgi:hypothetical protein
METKYQFLFRVQVGGTPTFLFRHCLFASIDFYSFSASPVDQKKLQMKISFAGGK